MDNTDCQNVAEWIMDYNAHLNLLAINVSDQPPVEQLLWVVLNGKCNPFSMFRAVNDKTDYSDLAKHPGLSDIPAPCGSQVGLNTHNNYRLCSGDCSTMPGVLDGSPIQYSFYGFVPT